MKTRAIQYVVLIGVAAVFLGPLYWLLSTAFKQPTQIYQWPPAWWPHLTWENFSLAWKAAPFDRFFLNSTITTVLGTLLKGYEFVMRAETPANRAALTMFVVAEVHPFTDGNGRTARVAMNQFMTCAGLTRVIIPTVFRDDYLTALNAMSSNAYPMPLMRMFTRAARFSRWLDMSSTANCFAALTRAHAMAKPNEARLTFDDGQLEPTQENESLSHAR